MLEYRRRAVPLGLRWHVKQAVMKHELIASTALRCHQCAIGTSKGSFEILARLNRGNAKAHGEFWQTADRNSRIETRTYALESDRSVFGRTAWEGKSELLSAVTRHKVI